MSRLLLPETAGTRTIFEVEFPCVSFDDPWPMFAALRIPSAAILSALILCAGTAPGADRAPRPGEVGSFVPSYQMRTVAGPMMNRSICHVCRNGNRPVVMVVLRETGPKLRVLLRNLDRLLDRHRGTGLRGFCAVLSPEPFKAISRVQTFAFNGRVEMPVGVTPDALAGESLLNIPDATNATVFLYEDQVIRRRFDFTNDEPTHEQIREVLHAAAELVDHPSEPAAATSAGAADPSDDPAD